MNNDNILKEGFFDKIKKLLGLSTSQEKDIKNSKAAKYHAQKVNNSLGELNAAIQEFEDHAQSMLKDIGVNKKLNLKRYKIKDFL